MNIYRAKSLRDDRELQYDTATQEVVVDGEQRQLSNLTRRLLNLFLTKPNTVISWHDLHRLIWEPAGKNVSESAVRKTVGQLRKALDV